MQKLMTSLCLLVPIIVATSVQVMFGNVPLALLSFPVNVGLAIVWLALIWVASREWRKNKIVASLSSNQFSIYALVALGSFSFVLGLVPQTSVSHEQDLFGMTSFVRTWQFTTMLFLLLTNLAFVALRGLSKFRGRKRVRFVLNHFGLWLAIFASFVGSADEQTLQIVAFKGAPTREAFTIDHRLTILPDTIVLRTFDVEYYKNGVPSSFEARVDIGSDKNVLLKVNNPKALNFSDDLYLYGYDVSAGAETDYCTFQIVRSPWKYVTLFGIILMTLGALMLFMYGPEEKRNINKTKED